MINLLKKGYHSFKHQDKHTQWTLAVLALAILARFAITFFVHASGDSLAHLATARYIAQTNTIPLFEPIYRPFFYYPPLFHIIAAGIYKVFSVFGEPIATKSMDFIAPLFGSALLIFFYRFCRSQFSKQITLYAVVFLSFIPIHLYYSTLAHVDIAISFMAFLSLYLLYSKRFYAASITNGLGMITKYTHLFIFPALIVRLKQIYPDTRSWLKNTFLFFAISFIVGIPLYVRNYIFLGTPLWPFMNSVFLALGFTPLLPDYVPHAAASHLLDPSLLLRAYLDVFGVPLGLVQNISFVPLPFLIIWAIGTMIFSIPFIFGLFSKKPSTLMNVLVAWCLSYLIMILYFIFDYGDLYMRLLLPIFPALAIIWAYGLASLLRRYEKNRIIHLVIILLVIGICIGFTGVEFAKARIGAQQNERYSEDFEWIKQNIPDDALFDFHSTFLIYHTGKQVVSQLDDIENVDPDRLYHFEYPQAKRDRDTDYSQWTLLYENPSTGVQVLKKT